MTQQQEALLHLWAAVIQVAVSDILAARNSRYDAEKRASLAWVQSDDRHARSFLWACDMLSINPLAVRDLCVNNPSEVCTGRVGLGNMHT
jgi:hypothetical protein